jgi:hypothetical protein
MHAKLPLVSELDLQSLETSEIKQFDYAHLSKEKSIKKLLQPNEIIVFSCSIFKFNDYDKK